MNSPQEQNHQQKRQDLETEVNSTTTNPEDVYFSLKTESRPIWSWREVWQEKISKWFESLPQPGKIMVVMMAIVFGFSLLKTFFELVASLITLVIVVLVCYTIAKLGIFSNSGRNNHSQN